MPDSDEWAPDILAAPRWADLEGVADEARAIWSSRATPTEIGEVYKRLAIACRGQPGDTGTKTATVALFLRYLSGYPLSVLSAAADFWITTKVFMPAISEMRGLCEAEMTRLERIWQRADGIIRHSREYFRKRAEATARDTEIKEANAKMTPERWAEIKAARDSLPGRVAGRDFANRHPKNRDTDSPEEKERIRIICERARAEAAAQGLRMKGPPNDAPRSIGDAAAAIGAAMKRSA